MEDPIPVDSRWRRRIDQFSDIPAQFYDQLDSVLITAEERQQRIDAMAANITQDYQDANIQEVATVYVLQGAIPFFVDLVYSENFGLDPLWCYADSIRYRDKTTTEQAAEIYFQPEIDTALAHQHALIVEDIIDEGFTLAPLVDQVATYNPLSVSVAALVEKPEREQMSPEVDARYVGFSIPNEFIVGHGFDYGERYRELPHICVLADEVKPDI